MVIKLVNDIGLTVAVEEVSDKEDILEIISNWEIYAGDKIIFE